MVDAAGPVGEPDSLPGAVGSADAVGRGAAERLVVFSDAVVAIAITLLAIDLPVPTGDDAGALLRSLGDNDVAYLTFVLSFVVIAAHWRAHHAVFRWLHRVDPLFVRLNLAWLLMIVATPFLTEVIREGDLNVVRFGLYALAQTALLAVFSVMQWVAGRRGLFAAGAPAGVARPGWYEQVVGPASFALSVPLYLLVGAWAFALWALGPNLLQFVRRAAGRSRAH